MGYVLECGVKVVSMEQIIPRDTSAKPAVIPAISHQDHADESTLSFFDHRLLPFFQPLLSFKIMFLCCPFPRISLCRLLSFLQVLLFSLKIALLRLSFIREPCRFHLQTTLLRLLFLGISLHLLLFDQLLLAHAESLQVIDS